MITKTQRHESKKIRDSARGRECQIRLPGICNGDNDTVVLCHINGGGMGTKHSDLMAAYGCSSCHAAVDKRTRVFLTSQYLELAHLQGVIRTQQILLDEGLVWMV